ncbi:hypothetical protein PQR14_04095 [Paraburkholderia bryophila]|uniref:hypothetical protein n=1 Tax=Burkholderiaceae TaxID=119060 RepID=UPI00068DEF02|nr:hypothetical protein [Burkholderia sp. 9120]
MVGRKLSYAAIALMACAFVCAAQTLHATISDFVGKWTFTDVVDYLDLSDGLPEAKRILGLMKR